MTDETNKKVEAEEVEATEAKSTKSNTENNAEKDTGRVYEGEAEVLATEEITSEEKTWSMLAHLSALVALIPVIGWIGMIVGPLIIWLFKKNESKLVDENAKEALNFNITMLLGYVIATVLIIVLVGLVLWPLLVLFHFVLIVIASIKANEGEHYKYPFALRLIN